MSRHRKREKRRRRLEIVKDTASRNHAPLRSGIEILAITTLPLTALFTAFALCVTNREAITTVMQSPLVDSLSVAGVAASASIFVIRHRRRMY